MEAILSLLSGGFFGALLRLAPEVIKLFTSKADRDHEYRMRQLDLEAARQQSADRLKEIDANASVALDGKGLDALTAAITAQGTPTGFKFIDAISASVRPFVTYWWMALYTMVKVFSVILLTDAGAGVANAILSQWNEWDQTTLGGILAFWFLDRVYRKRG